MRRCSTKNCALSFIFLSLTGLLFFLESILPSSNSVLYDEEKTQEKLVRQSGGDGTTHETQAVGEIGKGSLICLLLDYKRGTTSMKWEL